VVLVMALLAQGVGGSEGSSTLDAWPWRTRTHDGGDGEHHTLTHTWPGGCGCARNGSSRGEAGAERCAQRV